MVRAALLQRPAGMQVATHSMVRSRAKLIARTTAGSADVSVAAPQTELKLIGPEPQRFAIVENDVLNIATAAFCPVVRLGLGALAAGYKSTVERASPEKASAYAVLSSLPGGLRTNETSAVANFRRPEDVLVVYDQPDCAGSLQIRETCSILDLDTLFKPCPEGGRTWRNELAARLGSEPQLPYFMDPNNGTEIAGDADEIVAYLWRNYGNNRPPLLLRKGPLNKITAALGMLARKGKFSAYIPSRVPEQPLEFWGYEASPFCVIVREVLTQLETPYVLRPTARGSPKRQQLFERRGLFQVPYLEDANEGVAMFESAAIIAWLKKTYGA